MFDNKTDENGSKASETGNNQIQALSISLPKGGGAIHGIGEKFAANPVTGTGSMPVPIATSPGRSGFGPHLSLTYDSGSGNGSFGFGWDLSLPAITRKTDKGLPQYRDTLDSDVFILSGVEDLVPVYRQDPDGTWVAAHAGLQRDADTFNLPIGTKDPFGLETIVTFDQHVRLIEKIEVKQAAWHIVNAVNAYRVLGPVLMTDPNGPSPRSNSRLGGRKSSTPTTPSSKADGTPTAAVPIRRSVCPRRDSRLSCIAQRRTTRTDQTGTHTLRNRVTTRIERRPQHEQDHLPNNIETGRPSQYPYRGQVDQRTSVSAVETEA